MTEARHAESEKTKVFVSYSRKDRDSVRRLTTALEADGEIDVLLDTEDILPTEEWRARLEGLIGQADTVVFCLTPRSAVSEVCAWEVETAERLNKRIAPVVIEEVAGKVPQSLAKLNYIFFTSRDDFDAALAKLREALDADIDWIREHTRLGDLARRWDVQGRRRPDLLRGPALDAAEAWLIDQPARAPAPTALHRDFVGESRRAATRRKNWWIAGSTSVAAGAIALALTAYWQRGVAVAQRTEATARQLSAEAQVVLSDPLAEPATAVRDLLMSLSLSPSPAATEALKLGTSRLPPRRLGVLPWPDDVAPPRLLAFSPDGAWLGMITTGEALFWDVAARRIALRQPVPGPDGIPSLVFADGAPRVLVAQLAEPGEPDAGAAWTAIDLATGQIETTTGNDAFDALAVGSDILVLRKPEGEASAEVVDLMTGSVLQQVAVAPPSGAPVFGRFFRASATPPPFAMMFPMLPSNEPLPTPQMILLVDGEGMATAFELGAAGATTSIALPKGALPLAVDAAAGLLAVRQPDAGDAVLRLPAGDVIWQAPENAESFRGFAGRGRFLVVQDDRGGRLESIGGGSSVRVEPGRRTDWDLTALNDLAQYTPIVSVEVAEQSGLIVTARRDGRVAVWRPGMRPRYGGIDGWPRPSFEAVASFDHGDGLGVIEPFWTAPPVLFVSADGRFIASQSQGIETTPVGGITKFEPLVRIWDSRYSKEIGRFRPSAPMLVAFAPAHGVMATMLVEPSAPNPDDPSIALELWDLSDRAVPFEEHSETRMVRLTPAAPAQAGAEEGRDAPMAMPSQHSAPIWVGADLRLRASDPETEAIVVVEDLTPVLRDSTERLDARIDQVRAGLPAEVPSPLFPVAVSADGRRAVVALGRTVRLYALDGHPRLLRSFDVWPAGGTTTIAPSGLALSPEGEAFAVTVMTPQDEDAQPQMLTGAPPESDIFIWNSARLLVFRADAATPIHDLPQQTVGSHMIFMRPLEQMIALGPEGRLILVDETTFRFDKLPPEIKARLKVRDLTTNEEILALPERDLFIRPTAQSMEAKYAAPPVAAFNKTGGRLVVIRDRPDCPMKEIMTPSMLPVHVPSCRDRRITLSIWSMQSAKQVAAASFVEQQPGGAGAAPADLASTISLGTPGTASARIALEGADPPAVLLDSVATRAAADGLHLEMTHTRRRIPLGSNQPAVEAACARLPRTLAHLDEATWAALVPAESYREICPPDAASIISR